MAVAGVAGGHDAVKHVNAVEHAFYQVFGCAHAHQVMRLVRGQLGANVVQQAHHVFFGFAHAQAAHRHARQVQRLQPGQRFIAQGFKHAALHNAKQGVGVL